MNAPPLPELRYLPPLPANLDVGIGVVGAGSIVRTSHLPAYSEAGFRVVALCDPDIERANGLARTYGIARVYASPAELLADPEVAVVDIAVPPATQPLIAHEAIAAGKHVLCHKPLAMSLAEAVALVAHADEVGVKLAVNQNCRWAPGIRAAANLLADGELGDPTSVTFDIAYRNNWDLMDPGWLALPEIGLRTDCVHHLDTCRMLLGAPESVSAISWRAPEQRPIGDTYVQIGLRYSDTLGAVILSAGESRATEHARWSVEGTRGAVSGTFEQYRYYGLRLRGDLELVLSRSPEIVYRPQLGATVIPHAFIGTMAQLLRAIELDCEAETSGRDNLGTMRLVEAASLSIARGRSVELAEIAE